MVSDESCPRSGFLSSRMSGLRTPHGVFPVYSNHFRLLRAQLACGRNQATHAQQVIRGPDQPGMHLNALGTAHHCLAETAIGLHPAEDFLYAFTLFLAHGITRVTRGAGVQSGRAAI